MTKGIIEIIEPATNSSRAARALIALEAYIDAAIDVPDPSHLQDLITDLIHLAAAEGYEIDLLLDRALRNFEAEVV